MKLGRVRLENEEIIPVCMDNDMNVYRVKSLFEAIQIEELRKTNFEVLSPVIPKKIIAVGLNYKKHADEMKMPLPEEPVIFLKANSAILAANKKIIKPKNCERLDYEAELAFVISKECKHIPEKDADDYILGYTAFNDVTARDLQKKDGQWARAKSFDSFAPFGPFIETEYPEPGNKRIQAILNGGLKQSSNTNDMIFGIPRILAFISSVMTLYPGDVIATGTPEGIGPMKPGDRISIRIEGLDELINYVA